MYIIPSHREVLSDYNIINNIHLTFKYYVDIWSHIYLLGKILSGIPKLR